MSGTEDSACVLVPGDVRLGTTGVEVAGWLVGAGAVVAVGVVLLLIALLVRARREQKAGTGVIAAAIVVLAFLGAGQISPAPASAAAATSPGCDLIGWSMLTSSTNGVEAVLSEDPTEVVSFTLKNVSNVPIAIQLRTTTKIDPAGLAPFIRILANCAGCTVTDVYGDLMGAAAPGSEFTLAGGQSVEIRFSAALLPGLGEEAQNKSATFGITALARQI